VSGQRKIEVLLAGPYPRSTGMAGTYGRILANMRESKVFRDRVEFTPHRVTLPGDGNALRRLAVDVARGFHSLQRRPQILHFIMQKYRALYREYPLLSLARIRGIKTVVDIRAGTLRHKFERRGYLLQKLLMRRILHREDAILLECLKDVPFVRSEFGREGLYVPNAVRSEDYNRISPAADFPGPEIPIRLIHSGRYSKAKGTVVLLQAMGELSRRRIRAELHLTGQGNEPDVQEMIGRFVEQPPAGISVIDHGWDVPDLFELLASAHVFVMPTTWWGEGHPNAVSEAMMAGLGMILTDWIHREDIVPQDGAILVPREDPVAVADAIASYSDSPELLATARQSNRRWVEERFLDTACYPRILDLYEKLDTPRVP
jgi:glycosyltransferase involved in cell wall biosynthesis